MRALLLAAGLGTRLQPLTHYLPKCLIPIHGRPLLDYWLESLLEHGVGEILVNTHYFAPLVVEYLEKSRWSDRITIVYEEKLLGTGGTILKNRAFFGDDAFLVAHADNITVFNAADFAAVHAARPTGADMTMMLFETPDPRSCGIVELDERGVVQAFHEKVASPPSNLANAAVYILEPAVIDLMARFGKDVIDFSTEAIPPLMGHIFTWKNSAYHRDIGTIASWTEAHRDFLGTPANAHNAAVWSGIMQSVDEKLSRSMAQLLAGDVSQGAA